jgi:CRISPR-associated protein Cas1
MANSNILEDKKDLHILLHSQRYYIYYLEHCKLVVDEGVVKYITKENNLEKYSNIPIANTTVILLGEGTSITQTAVRYLSAAGVLVGFVGNKGSSFFSGFDDIVTFFQPSNEYRPTEYMQKWAKFWFDVDQRLEKAKQLINIRIDYFFEVLQNNKDILEFNKDVSIKNFRNKSIEIKKKINNVKTIQELLMIEAVWVKFLYKEFATLFYIDNFRRDASSRIEVNSFLTMGNYLAYGIAGVCLWVLGINYSFALLHGKTIRGALVFDIADIIKDAIVLPAAFFCFATNKTKKEFKNYLLAKFRKYNVYQILFSYIKELQN